MDKQKTDNELLLDIASRTRRMETRLVRFCESQGLQFNTLKPTWSGGIVHIPNINCSIADMLEVVPADVPDDYEVTVMLNRRYVMSFFRVEV